MTLKRVSFMMLILLLAFVAACTPTEPEPGAAPAGEATPEDEAVQVAADALPAARLALAEFLGTTPDNVEMQQIEDAQWPNACLGLAEPGEMCAEVLTEGYLITFTYEGESYAVRTDLEGNAVRVEAAATETDEQPAAVAAARQALALELGVAADTIEVLSFEQEEWSDSCLGLGGPAESCLAAITPGWRVMLGVDGQTYEVRTDEGGAAVRIPAEPFEETGTGRQPTPVVPAREALAQELGIAPDTIELLSIEQQEWSDSCLGLGGPAESCLTVITPGYRLMLGVDGQTYEVRTDESGKTVRIASEQAERPAGEIPAPDLEGAVLFYQRSGGIAGEILTVRVYPDGQVERTVGRPEPDTPVEVAPVEPAAVEALLADLEAAGYFELERAYLPEDSCCDRYLYLISADTNGEVQTVEALEATPDAPEAVWDSVDLIESFVADAFAE